MTLLAEPIAPPIPVEPSPAPALEPEGEVKTKELVIVNWSGDLDKVWPVMILSSTALP